jgi:hypothetical protein
MLKRYYQHHPAFERFLSACGRVSGKLKQTLLACLAPPTVRTKARFMNVHRLFTWADRVLKLSPAGGAKTGSTLAQLRACLDELPTCKALIKRFRADASGLLECQKILKTKGLSADTRSQCEPLIDAMPSAPIRSNRCSGWPSTTAWARRRMRLASRFACRPYAVRRLGRKPNRSSQSVWQGNKSSPRSSPR